MKYCWRIACDWCSFHRFTEVYAYFRPRSGKVINRHLSNIHLTFSVVAQDRKPNRYISMKQLETVARKPESLLAPSHASSRSVNATPRCLTPKTNCSQFPQSKCVPPLHSHPVHLLYKQESCPCRRTYIPFSSPQAAFAAAVAREPRTPSHVIPHYWRLPWLLGPESLDSLSSSPVLNV